MRKMKKAHRRLVALGIIIFVIVLLFNLNNISYVLLPEYYNTYDESNDMDKINIEGKVYVGVNEQQFNAIDRKLVNQGIYTDETNAIGRMNYIVGTSIWRFRIYGNKNADHRILLKGKEAYTFNDANFPEVYFCREDILNSYRESTIEE